MSSRKSFLIASSLSALSLAVLSNPAAAQDAPAAETAATQEDDSIIVTGSRIARPEFAAPNPIQTFDSETIELSGKTDVVNILVDSPALLGSATTSDTSGSNYGSALTVGGTYLNLRNLGTQRTLVLVDGRRHVAGLPSSAAVDINTIPLDLIERVDVLTGGASAVYGADGVSGVVNFVMKRDFEGFRARGQVGISQRGDSGNQYIGLTAGKNFADGRGNVTLAYEYATSDRFSQTQRLGYGRAGPRYRFVANQADPFDADPTTPDFLPLTGLRWADTSPGGAFDLDYDFVPDFTGEGKVYDPGTYVRNEPFTIGGDSTLQEIYFGDTNPQNERHVANLLGSFEVSPALRLFANAKYARTKAETYSQPVYDLYVQIYGDNYFLNERFGSAVVGDALLLGRDHFDFGVRRAKSDRETIRAVVGADGELASNLRYELSYTFGQLEASALSQSRVRDRYYAAIDSVSNGAGGVSCRISRPGETLIKNFGYIATQQYGTLNPATGNYEGAAVTFSPSQCVPLNIMGSGAPSQAALDFVFVDDLERLRLRQHVVSGSIRGNTGSFFNLPGGPVAFAVGGEYRSESLRFDPSEWTQAGLLLDSSQAFAERGSFDVAEAFGEIDFPILRDQRFAEVLSVGGAIRLSDYSTVGKTTTWSVNGVYSPIRDITFRGTLSQSVRAPNLSELFSPASGTYAFIADPCGIDRITGGVSPTSRQANCTAILNSLGINPATFDPAGDAISPENTSLLGRAGGNSSLQEESARTWTAGLVLRPSFVPGLQIAADWYDIRIRQAINTPTARELAELCVDQPSINNSYCANLTRDPTTGYIANYLLTPANVANFDTEGLDVVLNYRFSPGSLGTFNLRVAANYLHKLEFIPTPGANIDDDRLEGSAPEFSGNADLTWKYNNFTLNYGVNYFSKTLRYSVEDTRDDPDITLPEYLYVKPRWEHEIQLAVDVNDRFTFYAGANNLFDSKPDIGLSNYPVSAIGRYLYAGFKAKIF
ncbi:TonB-dependent receptor domain-containing protein [Sphingomonas turrisvirgatae]|uniref:TonB-dependent receptor domain-containing protein n=1 Tax=Sphingomonas turrisvirgatae TaxID=1888892 RepID=UPI001F4DF30E|nr:TonB-dependent receptor [Sphingomonas turrisvirgatae]